jgi:hypothetical protein
VSDKAVKENRISGHGSNPVMAPFVATLLLTAAATTALRAQVPEIDPLSSSECAAAREQLEQAISEPLPDGQARSQRLSRARRQAALACLGPSSGSRERSGAPNPPQTVPPPVIGQRSAPPSPPAVAAPQPPLAIPRAGAITVCDPAGCWDSEGRRLNQMGPLLMGPRGPCTLNGGALNCP